MQQDNEQHAQLAAVQSKQQESEQQMAGDNMKRMAIAGKQDNPCPKINKEL